MPSTTEGRDAPPDPGGTSDDGAAAESAEDAEGQPARPELPGTQQDADTESNSGLSSFSIGLSACWPLRMRCVLRADMVKVDTNTDGSDADSSLGDADGA